MTPSMWLVQITVDPRCTRVFSGRLLDGHALHRDLMRLAPDGLGKHPRKSAGLLWRAEDTPQGLRVLGQLTCPPRMDNLTPGLAHTVHQRDLTPLLDRLDRGTLVRYRIAANATKRHGDPQQPHKKGKLANLHGTDADDWWARKATTAGLRPVRITSASLPDVLGSKHTTKNGEPREATRHGVTRFDGLAVITDPDLVRAAVAEGIGRARTYGCGLLSVGLTRETL